MRYEQARDSDARAGGLRDSAIRTRSLRCLCVGVLLLFVLALLPTRAFASHRFDDVSTQEWTSVWYHSYVNDGEQLIAGAYNEFDAAALMCGYSKSAISEWDMAVRYKLSTQDTAFLSLVNDIGNVTPWNEESLYSSLGEYFGSTTWEAMQFLSVTGGLNVNGLTSWQVLSWQQNMPSDLNVFALSTTAYNLGAAREAIQTVLNGGGSGGGGGTVEGVPEGYEVIDAGIGSKTDYLFTMQQYGASANSESLALDLTGVNGITNIFSLPNYVVIIKQTSSTTKLYFCVTFDSGAIPLRKLSDNSLCLYNPTDNAVSYNVRFGNATLNANTGVYVGEWGGTSSTNGTVNANSRVGFNTSSYSYPYPMNYVCTSNYMGEQEPDNPGDWPDDPAPEPPESPTVPTPTPPDLPTPYTPIIPPTVPPEPTTNVTDPTSWTDYTPWLQKILQQLRNINDEIGEHCVHLQQRIVDQATNIINALKAENEGMKDYLYELQRGLTNYLRQLFEWLADQFDFESNPYNDSSILYWLRLIYQRLGKLIRTTGPTILEPDPTEPFDFWAWLWNLITGVIGGFIGDFVGDVGGLIDAVKDKFPFSIPWDIAAMLALLDANRVTPVFVINIPAINGWWAGYSYRIDLQPFDSVAAACRAMFNIVWCFVLIMKTNWMLMIMGDSTSLGERFANRVGRGTE